MIGTRIKKLRDEAGITQAELADKTGININTLAGYERGTREPNIEKICLFADFFGVSSDFLLGLKVSKNPEHEKKLSDMMEILVGNLRGELPEDQEALIDIFTAVYDAYENMCMAELEDSRKSLLPAVEGVMLSIGACFDEARRIFDVIDYERFKEVGNPGYYYYANGTLDTILKSKKIIDGLIDGILEKVMTESTARLKKCYDSLERLPHEAKIKDGDKNAT